jgi:glycosyltransferase involved in cell wall biosynthesis
VRVLADGSPLRDGRRTAGIGRYITELAEALEGVSDLTFRLSVPPVGPPKDSWAWRFVSAQPWIVGRALSWRAELVHGMASDPLMGWPLLRQVVTVHDVAAWTTHAPPPSSPTGRYLAFQRRRLPRCAAVIAVSDVVGDDLARALRVPRDIIHVVPEGVGRVFRADPAPDDPAVRQRAGAPSGRYVLWVGSLRAHDARKAVDDLVSALAADTADAVPLVLVGSAGTEADRLSRVATESGVPLVRTGYVEDATLAALYRGAAAVALPSRHEGFGLTLLEAMACGAPVVTRSGGNLEALAGDAALLVPVRDVAALAQALQRVLRDPELQGRLRHRGPQRAAPYTWSRAAELTAEVYRSARRGDR